MISDILKYITFLNPVPNAKIIYDRCSTKSMMLIMVFLILEFGMYIQLFTKENSVQVSISHVDPFLTFSSQEGKLIVNSAPSPSFDNTVSSPPCAFIIS